MRRVCLLASAGVLVLLMSAGRAQAETIKFVAALSGGNEVPGVVNGAGGTATVTLDTATNAVTYRVEVYNMPSGTTASHFHAGAPGVGGPVVVNFAPPPNISNDYSFQGTASAADLVPRAAQGINSWEDFIQALLLGQIYVNVHSAANPAGEVRGQVVRLP